MHHPVLLLLLLLLIFLLAPILGHGIGALGNLAQAALIATPAGALLSNVAAPMAFVLILLFGVAVVGLLKLVVGF